MLTLGREKYNELTNAIKQFKKVSIEWPILILDAFLRGSNSSSSQAIKHLKNNWHIMLTG